METRKQKWMHSSTACLPVAGFRASALQAEGHRFPPLADCSHKIPEFPGFFLILYFRTSRPQAGRVNGKKKTKMDA
jgi:hypothetical protein